MDLVKPLKIENSATGGTEVDPYPREADPSEDLIHANGLAMETSGTSRIRGDAGIMRLRDSEITESSLQNVAAKILVFSKGGNSTSGTYLRIGEVPTSLSGFLLPRNFLLKAIAVTSSSALGAGNTSTLQLRLRTGVSTFADITGATATIPGSNYKIIADNLNVNLNANDEISAYVKSGSTLSNVVLTVYLIPR